MQAPAAAPPSSALPTRPAAAAATPAPALAGLHRCRPAKHKGWRSSNGWHLDQGLRAQREAQVSTGSGGMRPLAVFRCTPPQQPTLKPPQNLNPNIVLCPPPASALFHDTPLSILPSIRTHSHDSYATLASHLALCAHLQVHGRHVAPPRRQLGPQAVPLLLLARLVWKEGVEGHCQRQRRSVEAGACRQKLEGLGREERGTGRSTVVRVSGKRGAAAVKRIGQLVIRSRKVYKQSERAACLTCRESSLRRGPPPLTSSSEQAGTAASRSANASSPAKVASGVRA